MGPWGDESAGYGRVVSRRVCTILPTYRHTVVFLGGRDKGGRGGTKPAIFIIMVVINHQSINHSHYLNFLFLV